MRAGWFEVQDAGSQEIAPFLQPRPDEVVIDSCAGAGGKTLHLAALLHNQGRLLALDVHPWKLAALEKRAARAGVTCLRTQPITSLEDLARHAGTADRLLIDAPCSGLGVLRRHPDTKWKLTTTELARLVRLQQEILDTHSTLLKPGGTLVYATCSFLPEENTAQIHAFLARQPAGAWSLEEERLLLPDPARPSANHDAFYMARLRSAPH
jgi:16S rRNA (cytosine967-C5)-methyltransferase